MFYKVVKKTVENQPKIVKNGGPGWFWGVLGAFKQLWGGSWVPPGSEAPVGRFLGSPRHSLGNS